MIELPNGEISRTLPEQVGFNSQKIKEIIRFLNETGLKDLVINLESSSGTLSQEQYKTAQLSPSYILYNGKIYYKVSEDSDYIDFVEIEPKAVVDSSLLLNTSRIRIVKGDLGYSLSSVNIFESYNKSQIDSLFSTVNTTLSGKANLSGANFTGAITSPSIIESMSGYSFTIGTAVAGVNVDFTYIGAVKTGNKLTIVIAGEIEKTDSSANSFNFGDIYFPSTVGEKLYPYDLSPFTNIVANVAVQSWESFNIANKKEFACLFQKYANNYLHIIGYCAPLALNTKYVFRLEQTFLLSDNLAQ